MSHIKVFTTSLFITSVIILLLIPECSSHWGWGRRRRRRRRSSPPRPTVDCQVSAWGPWSMCHRACNRGYQERKRTITRNPSNGGASCPRLVEDQDCRDECDHHCSYRNGVAVCSCDRNYQLQSDNKTCTFVSPCAANGGKGPCSQICITNRNRYRGYICTCDKGYKLRERDIHFCIKKDCSSPRFDDCPGNTYSDNFGVACKKLKATCPSGTKYQAHCMLKCDTGYGVVKVLSRKRPFLEELSSVDFQNVPGGITCTVAGSNPIWTSENQFGSLYCRRTNDPPTSIQLSKHSILEHSKVPTVIGRLKTFDPQVNQSFVYTIVPSTFANLFAINGDSLVSNWIPSYQDVGKIYEVKVNSTDSDIHKPMFTIATFNITVINVNDPPHSIQISKNTVYDTAKVDSVVGALTAIDDDGPTKSQRSSDFVWKMVSDSGGKFRLQGAHVVVAASLAVSSRSNHFISVQCTDKDPQDPKTSKTVQIFINVIDINDSPKSLMLQENMLYENRSVGFIVGVLKATDQNGDRITFDISTNDLITNQTFSLGTTTCKNVSISSVPHSECMVPIVLAQTVDYETRNSYTLKVIASDTSGSKIFKEFRISILDVNEAPTDIELSTYEINENVQDGFFVTAIKVKDPDNINRPVQVHQCSMQSSHLRIHRLSILVKPSVTVDYETTPGHKLMVTITCHDNGIPSMSLTKTLTLAIKDENEPPYDLQLSSSSVDENAPLGHTVGVLSAKDPDKTPQNLVYSIVHSFPRHFSIGGKKNDELRLNGRLDYETLPKVDVTVKVTDKGGLFEEKIFPITVKDVNEPPTDIKLIHYRMNENSPPDSFISSMEVIDPDKNSSATCKVIEPDAQYINITQKGLFASAKKVDYETLPGHQFQLNIECTDNGGLSLNKSFNITIRDINEQPSSLNVNTKPIHENEAKAFAGQIVIKDPDLNQMHSCEILSNGKTNNHFEVEPNTLKIITKDKLDFEHFHSHIAIVRCHDLPAEAWQKKFYISRDVTFKVTDINEPPQTPCKDTMFIDEEATNATAVHTFMAYDPDNEAYHKAKQNGILLPTTQPKQQLTYRLLQGASDPNFRIVNSQYLVLKKQLLRGNKFQLQISVTDDGNIISYTTDNKLVYTRVVPLTATFTCNAEVLPSDDARLAPKISLSSNVVSEKAPNGTLVGELQMVKPKVGESYTFTLGNDEEVPFALVGRKLVVANSTAVNFEVVKSFDVIILASDSKGNTREKIFKITVTAVNEKPTDLCLIGNTIKEGLSTSTKIGTIVVVDPDYPQSGVLCSSNKVPLNWRQNYTCSFAATSDSIISGRFQINQHNDLTSKVKFDFSERNSYSIPLECEDTTKSEHKISKTVKVSIISSGCSDNFVLSNGKCICKQGLEGRKCDRNVGICNNIRCSSPEVCVSHSVVKQRCIGAAYQLPILLNYPHSLFLNGETRYNLEEFLEEIFENRSGNKNIQSVLGPTGSSQFAKVRRAIPDDVYVETTGFLKVSNYTYLIFVTMDPKNQYSPVSGAELCPRMQGKGLRCVNKEDCAILQQYHVPCPYGSGGLGAKKVEETPQKSTEPWKYSFIPIALIGIAVVALVGMYVIKRRRRSKSEEANAPFDDSIFVAGGHQNPVFTNSDELPRRNTGNGHIPNNLANPVYFDKKQDIRYLSNNLYDSPNIAQRDFGNPVYGVSPPPAYSEGTDNPVYESIGKAAGKNLGGKQVVDLPPIIPAKPVIKFSQKQDNRKQVKYLDDDIVDIKKGKNSDA